MKRSALGAINANLSPTKASKSKSMTPRKSFSERKGMSTLHGGLRSVLQSPLHGKPVTSEELAQDPLFINAQWVTEDEKKAAAAEEASEPNTRRGAILSAAVIFLP